MKRKKRRTCFVAFLLALCLPATAALAAEADGQGDAPADVLVVCRTQAEGDTLAELISACGKNTDVTLETDYAKGSAADYSYLVAASAIPLHDARTAGTPVLHVGNGVQNGDGIALKQVENTGVTVMGGGYSSALRFEEKVACITEYTGSVYGTVTIRNQSYPFAVQAESGTYVPYYREDDLSAILLGAVMQGFFGNTAEGKMYVVIDEVYAFTNLHMLCLTADLLYENAIPFIVRIMPIYDNLDYPAFQRYAQVLRYMQAKNGAIVLASPLVSQSEHVREPLEDKMARFHEALENEGIAYIEMEHTPYMVDANMLNTMQADSKNFGRLPIDTMVKLPLCSTEESLREETGKLNALWLSISNYRRNYTNANYQYREKAIDDQYVYVVEEEKLFAEEFAVGNEVLVVLVTALLAVLAVLVAVGARVYKRKFHKTNIQ